MPQDEAGGSDVCRVYLAALVNDEMRVQSEWLLREATWDYWWNVLDEPQPDEQQAKMQLPEEKLLQERYKEWFVTNDHLLEQGFTERGKPYYLRLPQLHFSLTHSGTLWACAFAPTEVGLDIQCQHSCSNMQRFGRRFFHAQEVEWLEQQQWSEAAFCRIWTAKEAYVKCSGDGLYLSRLAEPCLLSDPPGLQLVYLPAPPDYSLCLCCDAQLRVETVDL